VCLKVLLLKNRFVLRIEKGALTSSAECRSRTLPSNKIAFVVDVVCCSDSHQSEAQSTRATSLSVCDCQAKQQSSKAVSSSKRSKKVIIKIIIGSMPFTISFS